MSQFDWGAMDPNAKSGSQLAIDLNNFRDALNSLHRGISRPPYVQAGMLWLKEVTSEQWDVVLHDGQADLVLRSLNPTTSELFKIAMEEVDGLAEALGATVQKDAPTTTGAAVLPGGTTEQRPSTPSDGMLRFNTDISELERWQGGKWLALNILDKAINEAPLVTLASAATVAISAAAANTINISGTATISAFDIAASGVVRRLVFQAALTLTHNATSLILPGAANVTTHAGDVAVFVSLGSGNWKCVSYTHGDSLSGFGQGQAVQNVTSSRALATTYTNTTGKTIMVTVTGNLVNGSIAPLVDGVPIGLATSNNPNYTAGLSTSFPVPAGSTYRVDRSGTATLVNWSECR